MPPFYIAVHLVLTLVVAGIAGTLPWRARLGRLLAVGLLVLVIGGLVMERRTDWAWSAMRLGWPDLVFFTNLSLEGAALLLVVMWRQSAEAGARWRAGVLTPVLLGAALWSYSWYFAPVPAGLSGRVDRTGYCLQSSDDSCSAAAAAMILHAHGIRATEAEMATLCLTRAGHGTTPLGLFRGLALKARAVGLKPELVRASTAAGLHGLAGPGVVSVGLDARTPAEMAKRLEEFGWQRGVRHAVVVMGADSEGNWIDVADPSYGRERWPTRDPRELRYLWDGLALVLR